MPRRTLSTLLADVRSAVLHARFHLTCADESVGDPAGPDEMCREDYLRVAREYRAIAEETLGEAVLMLRRGTKKQIASWLAHRDPHVRQFVLERLGDG